MKQGETRETEENWYKRFKAECACDTLTVAGLDFLFYNPIIADLGNNPKLDETKAAKEQCKAMFFYAIPTCNVILI